jgi:outer membrane protein assembly factor BamB
MKQPKALILALIACLPLVLASCIGGGQPTGGWSGPTVHDGIVYVGTRDGRVVAINASSRQQQWEWPETDASRSLIYTTPVVHGDLVYIATYSGQVYALTSDRGVERWVYPRTGSIGAVVGTPVVVDETVYVTSSDGRVYALDMTYGDLKWESESLADKLWTSAAIVGDSLYVSTLDGQIYDLSLETGELLGWSFKAEAGFASPPVVHGDQIYVGSFDRYLYAIEIGSSVSMWRFPQEEPAGNWFWASPIVKEGIVYAACLDGTLYAIDATTGEEIWSYTTKDQTDEPSPIVSSPVLVDNLLVVVNESGTVYVFDVGAEFGDEVTPSEIIPIGADIRGSFYVQDGLVYVRDENSSDNQLYVVDIDRAEVSWTFDLTEKEE